MILFISEVLPTNIAFSCSESFSWFLTFSEMEFNLSSETLLLSTKSAYSSFEILLATTSSTGDTSATFSASACCGTSACGLFASSNLAILLFMS